MSGKRTKLIREAFERASGFTQSQRSSPAYKFHWRRFKKNLKRERR